MCCKIYAFDFDGTLTVRDTLLAFIKYAKGNTHFLLGFLRYVPQLVLMKLGLYPNWRAKQQVFSYFFKGMSIDDFDRLCRRFAGDNQQLLRPDGVKMMQHALLEGARVLVVSASIDNWVRPFFSGGVEVLGTQVEVADGRLTGRFLTKNCYGEEKVRRIRECYPDRNEYELIAFGDSRGDKEMLDDADEAHYKPFR